MHIFLKIKTPTVKILRFFDYFEICIPRKKRNLDYRILTICGIQFRIPRKKRFRKVVLKTPIQENKIVLSNFVGKSYGCNPKYIAEEIIRQGLPYDLVWLVNNVKREQLNFPKEIRLVDINSKDAYRELGSAKIWIDNSRKNKQIERGLVKKEGQVYIQTWHGSLGIKKLDADVEQFQQNTEWVERSKQDAAMMDYLLTNSRFEEKTLGRALWFKNTILKFGHPRNDIFFRDQSIIRKKIREYYGIDDNKKIMLYVPSFRDNNDLSWFIIDYHKVLDALNKRFGGDWVFVIRFHPRVKLPSVNINNRKCINATDYPDIQELLAGSDAAISDYSSCIYDFCLSKKPAFIFAPDIEKYNNMRGFYYPLEATPFPVSHTNAELKSSIENFNVSLFEKKCENFLKNKGCYEDGHAAERVVDLIKTIIKS
jgi:CDP-glycerol glycerophosphotransferase